MRAESLCGARCSIRLGEGLRVPRNSRRRVFLARSSQSMEERNSKAFEELGLLSVKKKIKDVVSEVDLVAKTTLEIEEARMIEKEELLKRYNLWDDPAKSNEFLMDLANSTRDVNALKDMNYKVEEAKLISQLVERDLIGYQLFKLAYHASMDVPKFLERYDMFKNLKGPYDREGASIIITTQSGTNSEIWAEKLLHMYLKWAEKQGHEGRVVEKRLSEGGGIKSASIEFELECFHGYLSGEEGVHMMMPSVNGDSAICEAGLARVEVIPIFLESMVDLPLDDHDLEFHFPSKDSNQYSYQTESTVRVLHIPTGIAVQCSGERSLFANKLKAVNRLKAKLLVAAHRHGVSNIADINGSDVVDASQVVVRRYNYGRRKIVQDMRYGFQLSDLNSVLNGNIEPFLRKNLRFRMASDMG